MAAVHKTPLSQYIPNLYRLLGGRYWHGMCGEIGTEYWWNFNAGRPATAKWYKNHPEEKALGMGVPDADCCGVDKAGRWLQSNGSIKRDSATDFNEQMLADECVRLGLPHGKIATLDRSRKGLILKRKGHMAVTVGDGKFIESRGSGCAIKIYDMSKELPFDEWYTNPFIDYEENIMIGPGDKGAQVYDLQTVYKALGYNIGAWLDMYDGKTPNGKDGSFGPAMQELTTKIRAEYKLPAGNCVDAALYGKLAIALMNAASKEKIQQLELQIKDLQTRLALATSEKATLSSELDKQKAKASAAEKALDEKRSEMQYVKDAWKKLNTILN